MAGEMCSSSWEEGGMMKLGGGGLATTRRRAPPPTTRLGDHAYVALRLEESSYPLAHQGVIVHQQYGDRLAHRFSPPSCNGQKHSTRVPLPGALSTLTCPPSLT